MRKHGADFMRTVNSASLCALSASEESTLALYPWSNLALCRSHLSLLERINNRSLLFSMLTWMVQGNLFRLPLCIIACSLLILRFFKPFCSLIILWVLCVFKEISVFEDYWWLLFLGHFHTNFCNPFSSKVGLLDIEKILPPGKDITAVGICSFSNGVPEIKSCQDLPYFLWDFIWIVFELIYLPAF